MNWSAPIARAKRLDMVMRILRRNRRHTGIIGAVDATRAVFGDSHATVLGAAIVEPAGHYRRRLMTMLGGTEGLVEWIVDEILGTALTSRQVKKDDRVAELLGIQTAPRMLMVMFESEIGFCECDVAADIYKAPKRFPLSAVTQIRLKGRLFFVTLKMEIEGNALRLSSGRRRDLREFGTRLKQSL